MNTKWRIEQVGGGQIADTGDYGDSMYLLTNGDIELVTRDELDIKWPEIEVLLKVLDQYKWEDWKSDDREFVIHILRDQLRQWKSVAEQMYGAMDHLVPTDIEYCDQAWKAIQDYQELKENIQEI